MSLGAILLIAQATAAPAVAPDVELRAHVQAREIAIEQEGPIQLDLRADPGSTDVKIERSQPAGAQRYRNLTIDARLAAYLKQQADGSIAPTLESSTGEQPQ